MRPNLSESFCEEAINSGSPVLDALVGPNDGDASIFPMDAGADERRLTGRLV